MSKYISKFIYFLLIFTLSILISTNVQAALQARTTNADTKLVCNPNPEANDIILKLPHNLSMVFRLVAVPTQGLLWDLVMRPGVDNIQYTERSYYDRRFATTLSAPFAKDDLPKHWQNNLQNDLKDGKHYFYLIAKYEVSRGQWRSLMDTSFDGTLAPEDAKPISNISWYEAIDFTQKYTQWLLENDPENIPHFVGDSRNIGFIRLPTETEWEYAARGGQYVGQSVLLQEDFFPLAKDNAHLADYAVCRASNGLKAEDISRIGSRLPNPLNLYDTAGNVTEMTLDNFRFSIAGRLHGSAGGFVSKGGSFLSDENGILPGRREEMPFFLQDGPAHAKDLGFRPVLSAINTPGGNRPKDLLQAWNKAGENSNLYTNINPLQELDGLLQKQQSEETKNTLQQLRLSLKEYNIALERQKRLEAESLLRTGVYMIETIRNYNIRYGQLLNVQKKMENDLKNYDAKQRKELEDTLKKAKQGSQAFVVRMDKSLNFYISRIEESCLLEQEILETALAQLKKDFSGQDAFNTDMRKNLDLVEKHTQIWRDGKKIPTKDNLRSQITEQRGL